MTSRMRSIGLHHSKFVNGEVKPSVEDGVMLQIQVITLRLPVSEGARFMIDSAVIVFRHT